MCDKNCRCDVLSEVIGQYTKYFMWKTSPWKNKKTNFKPESYRFIAYRGVQELANTFIDVKLYLRYENRKIDHFKPKFLDAGCGVGNIMVIAKACGFKASGIEYNTTIHRFCDELLNGDYKTTEVIKGDITKFKRYGEYDFIYSYVPIEKREIMNKCARFMADEMKVGAIIMPVSFSDTFREDKRFKVIQKISGCYEKIKQ